MDIGEEVDKQVGKPVGRPKGSSIYATSDAILEELAPYIKALRGEGKHPARALVAVRMGIDPDTLRSRHRPFFTWPKLLAALEGEPSN